MGGRGTFAIGNNAAFTYKTVGMIEGIKVLEKINPKDSAGLPEESHTSSAYILLNEKGQFKRYREYNKDLTVAFDIDFHPERKIDDSGKNVYHIHFYTNGIRDKTGRKLSDEEYLQYKKYFGGIQK